MARCGSDQLRQLRKMDPISRSLIAAGSDGIVTAGLVSYLDAGNPSSYPGSGTTWTDLSSSQKNAVVPTSVTYDSANGGTLYFDGTDLPAEVPGGGPLELTSQMTALVFTKYGGGGGRLYQKDGPSYVRCWEMGTYQNTFRIELWHSDGSAIVQPTGALSPGSWYHLVMSFDGTNIRQYINNSLSQTSSFPGDIRADSGTPLMIGGYWSGSEYYNGNVAIAQLYNRALSAAEIDKNFNFHRARFGL